MNNIQKRIQELSELLEYHSKKYYVEDNPEISDYEYDMMMRKLIALEEEFPQFKVAHSPSQRVGGAVAERFESVTHEVPLLSLQDAFSYEELLAFDERVKKECPDAQYVVELKIDK